jgi:hypothetical protein
MYDALCWLPGLLLAARLRCARLPLWTARQREGKLVSEVSEVHDSVHESEGRDGEGAVGHSGLQLPTARRLQSFDTITEKCDLWALGAVFIYAVLGDLPPAWADGDAVACVRSYREACRGSDGKPRLVDGWGGECEGHEQLCTFIEACLSALPSERPSASDAMQTLTTSFERVIGRAYFRTARPGCATHEGHRSAWPCAPARLLCHANSPSVARLLPWLAVGGAPGAMARRWWRAWCDA